MSKFLASLKNKKIRNEYLKSILAGWSSTALDFFFTALIIYICDHVQYGNLLNVFLGITADGATYSPPVSIFVMGTAIGFSIAFLFNYVLSVFFVYEHGNVGRNKAGFIKFAIFALIGLLVTSFGSAIGLNYFPQNIWVVKIVITLIVFVFNFFTRKFFIFNLALFRDDETTINL